MDSARPGDAMSSPNPRALPAIERLVATLAPGLHPLPRPLVVEHARRLVAELRAAGAWPALAETVLTLRRRSPRSPAPASSR